jgi:VanZ family protein
MAGSKPARKIHLVKFLRTLSLWLFWPGVALIAWGELTPSPPHLIGLLDWDKADHFIAYFGLASMATMILGLRPRLVAAIASVIFLSGALEILQAYSGRDAEILDFIANSLGAISGTLVAVTILLLFRDRVLVARSVSD